MNYYPFHVGDYVSATRHLSWDEDAAYRRMLDVYYTTEKPLPLEPRQVFRLVLATTDAQREAVQTVLTEFFEQTEQGWINRRADAEISAMRDKQTLSEQRAAHETERMRRHRERRAELFKALREVGVVPAWDAPMKELQRLHDEHVTSPETHLKREQVVSCNAPATAIPTPTPTPIGSSAPSARGTRLPHDELPKDWRDFALSERPDLDPDSVFARFADYWRGQPGAKGKKSDWLATWRNWVRDQRATPRVAVSQGQAMPWVGAL